MAGYARVAILVPCLLLLTGCHTSLNSDSKALSRINMPDAPASELEPITRARIQKASMTVEVGDPLKCASEAESLTRAAGGFVEHSTLASEETVDLPLRVPQEECDSLIDKFCRFGKVKSRRLRSEDVTESLVDVQARIQNLRETRDRLRNQLDNAKGVSDVLAIERELNRVQSQLESLEARVKVLRNSVAFTEVSLTLERRVIYGPLTFAGKAVWWGIEKLFVIK